jgi:hypothetical protein
MRFRCTSNWNTTLIFIKVTLDNLEGADLNQVGALFVNG